VKPWIRWGSVAVCILIAVAALTEYRVPAPRENFAGCVTAGRFDRIVGERFGSGEGTLVQGWLIAPYGGEALRLDGTTETIALQPSEERKDVQGIFPSCPAALASGFSLRLPDSARGKTIELLARNDRRLQVLDQRDYVTRQIRVDFDTMNEIDPDGRNTVSGWAMSPDGAPVKLEFLAAGHPIVATDANRFRGDVGAAYPTLSRAGSSGFEVAISFAGLPRGDYPLKVRATAQGSSLPPLEVDGPRVRNRHPYGVVLTVKQRARNPPALEVTAWLAHESGIKSARLSTAEGKALIDMVMQRSEESFHISTADLIRDMAPPLATGSVWHASTNNSLPAGIHRLQVDVTTNDGATATIPGQLIVNEPWLLAAKKEPRSGCARAPLRVFYPTGPSAAAGPDPQHEVNSFRDLVEGPCVQVGMRMRVEYLRTTRGRAHDFAFDPHFDSTRIRTNGRTMTTAGLEPALDLALRNNMPVLISLDGGVWADSAFPSPEWDVVDNLEEDEQAVQWNQFGRSEKDDALVATSGSKDGAQLARMMSLNVYNEKFRAYKKRNLQAAVAHIVAHQRRLPRHAVWINLDSDNYINPWFKDTQWYDYNPGTLRQFREWLSGTGPYASGGPLAGGALMPALDLPAINRIAKADWKELDDVDPPRGVLDVTDPWYALWIRFKRHLVARHYADLSQWACEAGMSRDRIYTAVGIADGMVPREFDGRVHGWNDQAGVSLRGGKPGCGHLGVVMYGPAIRGEGMRTDGRSILDAVTGIDPAFGVVEFHPANLDIPNRFPTHAESRDALERLLGAGARFLSPMWGRTASEQTLSPAQFRAFEAMEGTAFETELVRSLRGLNATGSIVASRRADSTPGTK
jgi:hypothetical protein